MKKIFIVAVVVTFLLSFNIALAQDLEEIIKAIAAQGVGWEAGENPIAELPDAVLRQMMGVWLPPIDMAAYPPGEPNENLPAEWDWRNIGNISWVTPVKNQGSCGSCWAFGAIAQLEAATALAEEDASHKPDLSEQYMVSCDDSNYGCNGGYMSNAYKFLLSDGVPDEDCFPYRAQDLPCADACKNPMLFSIEAWHSVSNTVSALQESVYQQPITCAFYVYRDFTYYRTGIYKYVYGDLLGGHAVCIVGWSVTDQCFLVKNSWGSDWGEDGYFRIAFSQVGNSVRFGIQAGKFDVESPSALQETTLITLWGNLKEFGGIK